jgi:hypothetical protein
LLTATAVKSAIGRACLSPEVVTLAEGVLRAMFRSKLKPVALVLVMVCLGGLSVGLVSGPLSAQAPLPPTPAPNPPQPPGIGGAPAALPPVPNPPQPPGVGGGSSFTTPAPERSDLERRVADLEKKVLRLTDEVEDLRGKLKLKGMGLGEPAPDVKVFALKTVDAEEVAQALRHLLKEGQPKGVRVTVEPRSNSVQVQADPKEMALIEAMILRLDAPAKAGAKDVPEMQALALKRADPAAMVKVLSEMFKGGTIRFAALGDNTIVVYGTPAEIADVKALLTKLEEAAPKREPKP